ncbi:cytochrome P450 [Nocardia sp. XZ_19_385]|uniref:cytochrome P450 n=1 Tax=Nocardia sp. XZ_19_385 TaxID=2769488 RepID=UPI00188E40EB|nr:cytochrome P450 [Nocardia sp. XZ_19_385]
MDSFAESLTVDSLYVDPYPIYARLRREEPVAWVPALGVWLVTRLHDVRHVMSSPDSFVTSDPDAPLTKLCGPGMSILAQEGDAHAETRESVADRLAGETIPGLENVTDEIATAELATLSRRDSVDLMSEYFQPVCGAAMARTLGLGAVPESTLRGWSSAFTDALQNPSGDPGRNTAAAAASREMDATLGPVLAELREHPDGSFLSALLHAGRPVGDPRDAETVLPTVKMMISAFKEPGWLAGNLTYALACHPGQLAQVRVDRELLNAAVHEAMRWLAPVGLVGRKTTRESTLDGVRLPPGVMVAPCLASANRDEREFDDAEQFDIHRARKPYLTLGYGRHQCLASALIPVLAEVAVDRLLRDLPNLRVEPDAGELRGWKFRYLNRLRATTAPAP